jgi:hypothetical protein
MCVIALGSVSGPRKCKLRETGRTTRSSSKDCTDIMACLKILTPDIGLASHFFPRVNFYSFPTAATLRLLAL